MAGLTFPHPLRITADPAGAWAGGLRHPPEADYPADMFTEQQLRDMAGDAALTLSVLDEDGKVLGVVPKLTEIPGEGSEAASNVPVTDASTQPAEGEQASAPGDAGGQPDPAQGGGEGSTGASSTSSGEDAAHQGGDAGQGEG